ncbi:MAG TPA: pyridoxal-dependent decarboxylase, partial [Opitutae bacterium]|nr:pyridoxal-dependent decarboxylase [Opitutae bacterium]
GSFDNLEMMASFASKYGIWFHVDGAHGAAQVFSKKNKAVLKGMEKADSVALDFHKMLGVPAICTGLFYRNGKDGYAAFSHEAHYLYESQAEEWWNFSKRTFECTKRMLSAAVFGIWENHGPHLWESLVDRLIENAQEFAQKVEERPEWRLFQLPASNIVCFRSERFDNDELRRRMISSGPFYIVRTVFNGQTWLRCTFQNPLTSAVELEELLVRLEELGQGASKR